MRSRRQSLAGAALVIAFGLVHWLSQSNAEVDGNRYSSKPWGVRLTAPTNWSLSQQTSYPNILLWMYRHTPAGKMMLSAECLETGLSSREYAERTAETLAGFGGGLHFHVGRPQLHAATGAYWLEFDDGKTYQRQALLVSGDIGYSLTLSTTSAELRRKHLRAWDYTLRSVRINRKGTQDTCARPSES